MNEQVRKFLSEAGRKGGRTTVEKYGRLKMSEWAKMGGRPKKGIDKGQKTIANPIDKAGG